MNYEEFNKYISSLSKDELIKELKAYKNANELYKDEIEVYQKQYIDFCNEVDFYEKKSSDFEEKYEKVKKDLQVYKILEKYRNKDDEEKRITKFTSNFLASCCSGFYFYHLITTADNINLTYFLIMLIPLSIIFYLSNIFITLSVGLLYQVVEDWNEKITNIFIWLLPFLLLIVFLLIRF